MAENGKKQQSRPGMRGRDRTECQSGSHGLPFLYLLALEFGVGIVLAIAITTDSERERNQNKERSHSQNGREKERASRPVVERKRIDPGEHNTHPPQAKERERPES